MRFYNIILIDKLVRRNLIEEVMYIVFIIDPLAAPLVTKDFSAHSIVY